MRRLAAATLALLALSACVTEPASGPARPASERAKIHTELANAYFVRGELKIAMDEIEKAQAEQDDYAPSWSLLALVDMALRQDDDADAAFRKALRLEPRDADTLNNYGWFLCERGRARESLDYFDRAARQPLAAIRPTALANAGLCDLRLNDTAAAAAKFDAALALRPALPVALKGRALLAWRNRDAAQTAAWLGQMEQGGALDAESLWLLIRAERRLRQAEAQQRHERLLLARFPDSPQATALKSGQYEQ